MEHTVQKDQLLSLACLRFGEPGEAVALADGLTVFVEKALPGERVLARVTERAPRYARARIERILEPSPHRVEPACPLYGRCGGCVLQHMDAQMQAEAKTAKIRQALSRIGGFAEGSYELEPICTMEEPFRYRNKAVFACGLSSGQPRLGLYEPGSHSLAAATDCLLQSEEAGRAAAAVEAWMTRFNLPPYDAVTGRGLLRHLAVRVNAQGEALVTLSANAASLPHADELIEALKNALPALAGVVLNQNEKRSAPILSGPCHTLLGRDYLEEELLGLRFCLSSLSFFQVNRIQTEKLYSAALRYASLTGRETVLDAYCGAGTITQLLARQAKSAVGVELYAGAVENARQSAKANGITNARFYAGSCETVLPRLVKEGLRFDAAVLDPPRRGCDPAALRALAQAAPRRIVYVSCDPATLARDLRLLSGCGYQLRRALPVDMFPQTGSLESVVQLERQA